LIQACQIEINQSLPNANFRFLLGTMVETVSLAKQVSLLKNIDYLVIGSNDLLSELMNINRDNVDFHVDIFFEPAFLNLVESIASAAEILKLPVFLCGEAANHPELIRELMKRKIVNFCPSPQRINADGELNS
jgi:phosphoenolpyruvate-protein kinase (PTS system EI component)